MIYIALNSIGLFCCCCKFRYTEMTCRNSMVVIWEELSLAKEALFALLLIHSIAAMGARHSDSTFDIKHHNDLQWCILKSFPRVCVCVIYQKEELSDDNILYYNMIMTKHISVHAFSVFVCIVTVVVYSCSKWFCVCFLLSLFILFALLKNEIHNNIFYLQNAWICCSLNTNYCTNYRRLH